MTDPRDPRAEAERLLKNGRSFPCELGLDLLNQIETLEATVATLTAERDEAREGELQSDFACFTAEKSEQRTAAVLGDYVVLAEAAEASLSALRSSLGQIRDEMRFEEEGYWADQIDALLRGEK